MKILVVCRYNQARSILAGAVIRKLFPEIEVVTAGIEAQTGQPIPIVTSELCSWWGLPKYDRLSQSLADTFSVNPAREFDAILAADGYVKEEILKLEPSSKIVDLSECAEDDLFRPIDPTGFGQRDFAGELAKVAVLTAEWITSLENSTTLEIEAFLSNSYEKANTLVKSKDLFGYNIILDSELERPNAEYWKTSGHDIRFFNPRSLNQFELSELPIESNVVLISKYEIDNAEKVYFSDSWKGFLDAVSQMGNVGLISISHQPDYKPSPLSILSTIHCARRRWI